MGRIAFVQLQGAQHTPDAFRQGECRPGSAVECGHQLLHHRRHIERGIAPFRAVTAGVGRPFVVAIEQLRLAPRSARGHLEGAPSLHEFEQGGRWLGVDEQLQQVNHGQRRRMPTQGQALVREGHDARRAAKQVFRQPLGLLVGPDEQGDVTGPEAVFHRLTNARLHPPAHGLETLVGGGSLDDFHLHGTGKILARHLAGCGVDLVEARPQSFTECSVQFVVEPHDVRGAAPIVEDGLVAEGLGHEPGRILQCRGQTGRVVRDELG